MRMVKKGHRYRVCPKDCVYRDRLANVCGVCLRKIMEDRKHDRQTKTEKSK